MYKLGSFEEILKVVDKRVSYQSDFYRLVISRGITTVDDALVAYKWYVENKNLRLPGAVEGCFGVFEYILFCSKYPNLYKFSFGEFRRLCLFRDIAYDDFYKVLFSELNSKYSKGMYNLKYFNYAFLWGFSQNLTDEEFWCLAKYYNFTGNEKVTFESIGKEYNVGGDKVQQCIDKAKIKLQHFSKENIIIASMCAEGYKHRMSVKLCNREKELFFVWKNRRIISEEELFSEIENLDYSKYIIDVKDRFNYVGKLLNLKGSNEEGVVEKSLNISSNREGFKYMLKSHKGLDTDIQYINMSYDTCNCLKKSGINTVNDLLCRSKKRIGISEIHGISSRSVYEVEGFLKMIGYDYDRGGNLYDTLSKEKGNRIDLGSTSVYDKFVLLRDSLKYVKSIKERNDILNNVFNFNICDLKFDTGVCNILSDAGVRTVCDLVNFARMKESVLATRGVGRERAKYIENFLYTLGFVYNKNGCLADRMTGMLVQG